MSLIPILAPILGKIVTNLIPDQEKKHKAEAEIFEQLLKHNAEIEKGAASIINTEAASTHWLAANWRPLTMIVFVGLIVARWFGLAAPNLTEAEYLKLWSIVELGLGGYVFGRTAEKLVPHVFNKK